MAGTAAARRVKLTKRQREVFELVAGGFSNREIAERLGISLDGAKWHVSELLGRVGVEDREQLAAQWPAYRSEPSARWIRRTLAIAAAVGGFAAVGVLALFVLASRGDEDTTPGSRAAEESRCPVDAAICEFALRVEFEFREGDPKSLISPKSEHYPDSGIIDAGIHGWREKPYYPHVIGIGCSVNPSGDECVEAFSLVLTASPEDEQEQATDRVLLGFVRDGEDLPIIKLNRLVGGGFNPVTAPVSGCSMVVLEPGPDCVSARFVPYTTGDPIPRPAATPTPSAPSNDPIGGLDPPVLRPGTQSSIRNDTVVYYSTGCFACGRPRVPNLFRFYRDAEGKAHTDDLLGALLAREGGYPTTFLGDWEHGRLLVGICTIGSCGGEGDPSPDARMKLFASRDGGITWNEQPPDLQPGAFLLGNAGNEVLVGMGSRRGLDFVVEYFFYPSMRQAVPPAGIGSAEPVVGPQGELVWRTYGPGLGAFNEAGESVAGASQDRPLVQLRAMPPGWLAQWREATSPEGVFGLIDGDGDIAAAFKHNHFGDFRGQLPSGLLYGNVELAQAFGFGVDGSSAACKQAQHIYPALVDWNAATVHPIAEFQDCAEGGHVFVQAIVARPVVRVNTGADCLNLRSEPSTTSQRLECFPDGVLLPVRTEGSPPTVPGWVAVLSPDLETAGWVAEEFVER